MTQWVQATSAEPEDPSLTLGHTRGRIDPTDDFHLCPVPYIHTRPLQIHKCKQFEIYTILVIYMS